MNKREKVFEKTQGKCVYCGCDIDFKKFHIEHKKPKKILKRDYDNIDNLFPACQDCNLSKGDLSVEEFREKLTNMINDRHIGRLFAKYYNLKPTQIKFYFEKGE